MCGAAAEIRPSEGTRHRLEGGFLLMPQRDNTSSLTSNFYTCTVQKNTPPAHILFWAVIWAISAANSTQSPLLTPPEQIAETYAFLPREAVTRFLMSCGECQKRMHINPSTAEFKGNDTQAHPTYRSLANSGHIIKWYVTFLRLTFMIGQD